MWSALLSVRRSMMLALALNSAPMWSAGGDGLRRIIEQVLPVLIKPPTHSSTSQTVYGASAAFRPAGEPWGGGSMP